MKRSFVLMFIAAAIFALVAGASESVTTVVDDTALHKSCVQCGMDRERFNHARMLIEYEDGTSSGLCSLHCASLQLKASTQKVKAVKVADMISRKLIPAETAYWVIGGTNPGVMTGRAKWAFRNATESTPRASASSGKRRKARLGLSRLRLTVTPLIAQIRPLRCHASTIGVRPLGAWVRRTTGVSRRPQSSRKTR